MWMMILGSQTLSEMRGEAERWLVANGHELEAQAILGRRQATTRAPSAPSVGGRPRPAPARHDGRRGNRTEQGGKPRAPRRPHPKPQS
jgi:hypothetical protein